MSEITYRTLALVEMATDDIDAAAAMMVPSPPRVHSHTDTALS